MLYNLHAANSYQWAVWRVTESLDQLRGLLPDHGAMYQDGLNAFKSESRKIEWLAVRVLLYTLLGESRNISYHPNGKPYFVDSHDFLSISHTKGYVAVIVSKENEVGIDIEKISGRVHKVSRKFVRDDEQLPDDPEQRTQALLLIWSAKETIFKCMNQEAVDFREHMHVDLKGLNGSPFTGSESRSREKRTYTIHYILDSDFVMTYIAER